MNVRSDAKIEELSAEKRVKIDAINQLQQEINVLQGFLVTEESRNIPKIWEALKDQHESQENFSEDDNKIQMMFEVNGIKILDFKRKLINYNEECIESKVILNASCRNYIFNAEATIVQGENNKKYGESLNITKLAIQVEEELAEEIPEFIQRILDDRALQRFLTNFPKYCMNRDARASKFELFANGYSNFIAVDKKNWTLELKKDIHSPKVIVSWTIGTDDLGFIDNKIDISIEPTGLNHLYDEIPNKFKVMLTLMDESEALTSLVDTICNKE